MATLWPESRSFWGSIMKRFSSVAGSLRRIGFLAAVISAFIGVMGMSTDAVGQRTVRIISTTAQPGQQVSVVVEMDAIGNEFAGGFTLQFDPTKLSISNISTPSANPDVTRGSALSPAATQTVNANFAPQGRIGVLYDSGAAMFSAGNNRQWVVFRFTVAAGAAAGPTNINFVSNPPGPIGLSVADEFGNELSPPFVNGTVTIQTAAPPVSVSGRVTRQNGAGLGNARVIVSDANNNRYFGTTSTFGYYIVTGLPSGVSYTITVSSRRYQFTPQTMTISSNLTDVNFTGTGQ